MLESMKKWIIVFLYSDDKNWDSRNKPKTGMNNLKLIMRYWVEISLDWPNNHLLRLHNKKGSNETSPCRGVIFTQNIEGLSRKDSRMESLLEMLVEIMISN